MPSTTRYIPVLILNLAGYLLTIGVFYPGVVTVDAIAVYRDTQTGFVGDWQSPVMGSVWKLIDHLARAVVDLPPGIDGGIVSMFLLMITLYWLGFLVLSLAVARSTPVLGMLLPLLALSPPAFAVAGTIWRDILLAGSWLLAAALVYSALDRPKEILRAAQIIAVGLLVFGLLLRPNAVLAAPLVLAYILWPTAFLIKRTVLLYAPAVIGSYLLVQFVYYGVLDAKRQYIEHAILVFDLGGITALTKENQFPVTWTDAELQLLREHCYDPSYWDTYWRVPPCQFVMGGRLERDAVFGTPALADAWRKAVTTHPLTYLRHRLAHMWAFLTIPHSPIYLQTLGKPTPMYPDNRLFVAALKMTYALKDFLLFRPLTWFLLVIGLLLAAWRYRTSPPGAYVVALSASAFIYTMSFLVVGVASDYRYVYWPALVALTGLVMTALAWWTNRPYPAETANRLELKGPSRSPV